MVIPENSTVYELKLHMLLRIPAKGYGFSSEWELPERLLARPCNVSSGFNKWRILSHSFLGCFLLIR